MPTQPEGRESKVPVGATLDESQNALEGLLSPQDEEGRESPDEQSDAHDSDTPQSESEDQSTDEQADEPAPEPEPRHKIRVADQDVEVTLDELKRGYSRTSDYTQKTQALAEQRRTLEGEAAQTRESRRQYAALLDKVGGALEQMQGDEPDWAKVRAEQPDQYPAMWTDWQRRKDALANVAAERERVGAEERADLARRHQQFVADERARLTEVVPEWRDSAKLRSGMEELARHYRASGFSDEDLSAIADHRAIVVMRKAMLYDRLQEKRPDAKRTLDRKTVRTAAPGTPKSRPAVSPERKIAAERFAKSRSVDDAAELLRLALDAG